MSKKETLEQEILAVLEAAEGPLTTKQVNERVEERRIAREMPVVNKMIEFVEREMTGWEITRAVIADGLPCYGLEIRQGGIQKIVWVAHDPEVSSVVPVLLHEEEPAGRHLRVVKKN